jgi:hypothetical protein
MGNPTNPFRKSKSPMKRLGQIAELAGGLIDLARGVVALVGEIREEREARLPRYVEVELAEKGDGDE